MGYQAVDTDLWPAERERYTDPATGVRLTRLTSGPHDNNHLYFTGTSFSPDGSDVLFVSNRTGTDQIYSVDLASGQIRRHTTGEAIHCLRVCRNPRLPEAYYFDRQHLVAVNLETNEQRHLAIIPAECRPSQLTCSASGRYVAFAYREDRALVIGKRDDEGGGANNERLFQRPSSVIIAVDLQGGASDAVWGETEWIEHPQFSPVDDNLLLFCHAGRAAEQRMWLVERQFKRKKKARPLFPEAEHQRAVHEYFLANGDVGFQLYEEYPHERVMYWAFIGADGANFRRYRCPGRVYGGHMQSDAEHSLVVADKYPVADAPAQVAHHTLSLMAVDPDTPEPTFAPLCEHGTSWSTQRAHCHPIFSPDGRYVLFTSDRGGHCQLYLAAVDKVADQLRQQARQHHG